MARRAASIPQTVTDDTPLRLEIAAAIGFPDGSMTAAGLRTERDRGRLAVERIAGKDFTTLGAIAQMRKLCRSEPKAPASTSDAGAAKSPLAGSSETAQNRSAQDALLRTLSKLKNGSPTTSLPNTNRRASGDVIPLKLRSLTC